MVETSFRLRKLYILSYQNSTLWKNTLAVQKNDKFKAARGRLRSAYEIFWERGTALANTISSDVPDLTLHDAAHLEALWDRASQLIRYKCDINPLEAFIFGGAVILHDIGHAVAGYPGGLAEVKGTLEYRDALAFAVKTYDSIVSEAIDKPQSPEVERYALLDSLRRLHARQAERLADQCFNGLYLIDDSGIRDALAQLIGQIAASHQWDRGYLDAKLPGNQGAPGFLPQEWQIQPLKLACLLRCADAIQIDQRRAPAFSMAIQHPTAKSTLHWIAQQIAQPFIADKRQLPSSLTFTSQRNFSEQNADAWWIAYDLLMTADSELAGCYQIMKAKGLSVFTVDRVSGATDPLRLSEYVRTSGWKPVPANVKVTDVEQIIKLFGGESLYGREPAVPLRELIQNAADSIRARRYMAGDTYQEGKIVVILEPPGVDGYGKLIVTDNGLGMDAQILTGPLIEFGKSFWTSARAQDWYPGLISSGLRQGGKFGIGFFSTLMIAEEVTVTSSPSYSSAWLRFAGGCRVSC